MAKKDYGFSTDLLWETLWESTDDGLVIVDKDGIINEVNEASIKIHCINFKGMHISEYAKAIERFSVGKNTPAAVAELMISRALVGEKTQKKRWFLRSAARPEGYYSDTTGHTIRNEKGENEEEDALTISQEVKVQITQLMNDTIDCWYSFSGGNKANLAERSGIWKINVDGTSLRTRTLDRYLKAETLPIIRIVINDQ